MNTRNWTALYGSIAQTDSCELIWQPRQAQPLTVWSSLPIASPIPKDL